MPRSVPNPTPDQPIDELSAGEDAEAGLSDGITQARLLLDDLGDACLIADDTGRTLYANRAARKLLRLQGRVLGRKIASVLADHAAEALFEDAARSKRQRAAVLGIAFSGQGVQQWRVSITPFTDGGTGLLRVALHRCTESVGILDPQMDRIAAGLQKLSDPLTIIHGYLENLLDGVIKEPASMRQCLSAMQRQAGVMQRVLGTLGM